ncbi:uncharacterized protein LOC103514513 [Diaphorina citri]|uniref:Uncharacterized protein LOC103514513 n=1 Tax=Diaphorina citri TaxID=121845 RepID=A0A1S4EHW5_DIACI|nr:uncharacterized protein LOC103514513 [Diaphorina citri]
MDVSSRPSGGAVQIKHKKQSSQDSGTFLDWDETVHSAKHNEVANTINFNSNVTGEFVTVVAIETKDAVDVANNNFVTVLTVNSAQRTIDNSTGTNGEETVETDVNRNVIVGTDKEKRKANDENGGFTNGHSRSVATGNVRLYANSNECHSDQTQSKQIYSKEFPNMTERADHARSLFHEREILVYRLPGERLGFGLKFEGGLQANQKVHRLFVQSCAEDSPASRTRTPWGHFTPGDEIVRINNRPIRDLTRIDCVKFLKESTVVLKLYVRHLRSPDDVIDEAYDQAVNARAVNEIENRRTVVDHQTESRMTNARVNTVQQIERLENKREVGDGQPKTNAGKVTNEDTEPTPPEEVGVASKSENSSPPPIPPRKLLKKTSNPSVADKRRTSPKASPRSLTNTTENSQNLQNGRESMGNNHENQITDGEANPEIYEVDLKLSDQDIDEIIDILDKTEHEETKNKDARLVRVRNEVGKAQHPIQNGKHLLDINDNVKTGQTVPFRSDSDVAEAELYTNLFLDNNDIFESESDDTGSSHTTAIDRLSLHSSDRISLTSSSSYSDIKSLNSYEFDLDANIDTVIDFDKVLEPLEGGVETMPIETGQMAESDGLYGPFLKKSVEETVQKNEQSEVRKETIQRNEQNNVRNADVVEPNRPQNGQDVPKVKGQTVQSPKPLPRTDMQKLKFKSGKKMPPPPPPPGKVAEDETKSAIGNASPDNQKAPAKPQPAGKNNAIEDGGKSTVEIPIHAKTSHNEKESPNLSVSIKDTVKDHVDTESTTKTSKSIPAPNGEPLQDTPGESKTPKSSQESGEPIEDQNLYITVEQIPIDNLLPKVIKAQEKVPADPASPYKDHSILETIVENDEHHLPRLIDFVPKDKIRSTNPEKSKKLNSIIEQQKVVEYFTSPHSPTKNLAKSPKREVAERSETRAGAGKNGTPTKTNQTNEPVEGTTGTPTKTLSNELNEGESIDNSDVTSGNNSGTKGTTQKSADNDGSLHTTSKPCEEGNSPQKATANEGVLDNKTKISKEGNLPQESSQKSADKEGVLDNITKTDEEYKQPLPNGSANDNTPANLVEAIDRRADGGEFPTDSTTSDENGRSAPKKPDGGEVNGGDERETVHNSAEQMKESDKEGKFFLLFSGYFREF